ncbi:sensor domain-containing diguanylate cyclase [Bacillus rubiinfantis]|uniref:sensor domain-containing diguanylate cyclase n=1 Tax=Bacillus rubiinfantis TaxID=1499680 RepID=UPI000693E36C|nr:GGDEF domain-containing protein [Bacillus rubiinfantis]
MHSHLEYYHWLFDFFLLGALLWMTGHYLRIKKKPKDNKISTNKGDSQPYHHATKSVSIWRQFFQRKELERKFLETLKDLQDLKFALDEANIVQIVDKRANILYANERFCRLSGYTLEELNGKNMRIFNSHYHSKEFFRELWATVSHGNVWRGEMRNQTKDGRYFWVDTTIVPFLDKDQKPFQYIVIRSDITKSKENEEKLEYLSNVDGLTSLFNRRYFDQKLEYYWHYNLQKQTYLSVILVDVDYFKDYNDTYGHLVGDQCLQTISSRVKELLCPYEAICARYGGEEFAIILSQKEPEDAHAIGGNLRQAIEDLRIPHEHSRIKKVVTLSFGIASIIPDQDKSPTDLLELADQALYQAKRNGRNTVVLHEELLQFANH